MLLSGYEKGRRPDVRIKLYKDIDSFRADTFGVFLEDEIRNNIQIGIITGSKELYTPQWLLCAVLDDDGSVILTAMCTPPFSLLLYESYRHRVQSGSYAGTAALKMLVCELMRMKYEIRAVLAERELARRFADEFVPDGDYYHHMSMSVMRLDKPEKVIKAPGVCRELRESDLLFAPYWEHAFSKDCRVEALSIEENEKRIRGRLGRGVHLFWEDGGIPVSQAVHGRSTINGAVINSVYTPPHYRGRGYATSVVAQLSERLLGGGLKFCCLFADESNHISRAIYKKIGFYDIGVFDEIKFR